MALRGAILSAIRPRLHLCVALLLGHLARVWQTHGRPFRWHLLNLWEHLAENVGPG